MDVSVCQMHECIYARAVIRYDSWYFYSNTNSVPVLAMGFKHLALQLSGCVFISLCIIHEPSVILPAHRRTSGVPLGRNCKLDAVHQTLH